jgi:hypothetical protein
MKRFLLAAASLATLAVAAPAFAVEGPSNNLSTTITINGTNPPQCNVSATSTTVSVSTNSISTTDGTVNPAVADAVATALNGAGVAAWCTGNTNAVVLSRTALTTNGGTDINGFAAGVRYDLWMTISDALSTNTGSSLVDGTSDGAGNGPGAGVGSAYHVSSFGPTGTGTPVVFSAQDGNGHVSAVSNANPANDGDDSTFTTSSARLVAGAYTGSVTLTLSPGL